jgi:hypothetical protein
MLGSGARGWLSKFLENVGAKREGSPERQA